MCVVSISVTNMTSQYFTDTVVQLTTMLKTTRNIDLVSIIPS